MTVICLTTDFGEDSPAAGQLQGILLSMAPQSRIVDLTQTVPKGSILFAQVILENALPYFPDGTVFLCVVDPSSTRQSRPLAARLGPMLFAGPDNGLITPLLERAESNRWPIEVYHANKAQYWQGDSFQYPELALYAPIAGRLAQGIPPSELGVRVNDPVRMSIPAPEILPDGWRGQVVQVDSFGNLAVNIRKAHLVGMGKIQISFLGTMVRGLSRTFGDGQPGELIALVDSSDWLSICIVNGNAAERLGAGPGTVVDVREIK